MILAEGDRVSADAVLLSGEGILSDESLLTGESAPVRKKPGGPPAASALPGGEGDAPGFNIWSFLKDAAGERE
jgi:Ca2+-transporting ATPase